MVTVNNMLGENSGTGEFEFKGLSTDEKPTGTFGVKNIGENSLFLELDTGKTYYYSEGSWSEVSMGSSGSGGGSGAGLPSPGAAGNVLTSNGTAWGSAAPPDNDFIVDFTIIGGVTPSTSTRVADIIAAKTANKNVMAKLTITESAYAYIPLTFASPESVYFSGIGDFGDGDQSVSFMGSSGNPDDTWTPFDFGVIIPHVTSTDNGKVLGVDDGAWGLVDLADMPNAPLILTGTTSGSFPSLTITLTEEIADIYAAASNKKPVYVDLDMGLGNTARMSLISYQYANSEYDLTFALTAIVGSSPVMYSLHFENSQSASLEFIAVAAAT